MGLKFQISALTDVAEAVRGMYRQEGSVYVLDVEGAVPKERLDEFRTNNITLQQQLDKLKDIDPVKYRDLTALQRKLEEKELLDKGEVDKVVGIRVEQMRTELQTTIDTQGAQLTAAQTQLNKLLVDNVVKSAALKHGVLADAVDDVVLRAKNLYVVKDGVPTPTNEKGEVIYSTDGKTPMPVEEWLTNLKKSAKHLFAGSSGGGAGGGHRSGSMDISTLTPAQKINLGLSQGGLQSRLPGAG